MARAEAGAREDRIDGACAAGPAVYRELAISGEAGSLGIDAGAGERDDSYRQSGGRAAQYERSRFHGARAAATPRSRFRRQEKTA